MGPHEVPVRTEVPISPPTLAPKAAACPSPTTNTPRAQAAASQRPAGCFLFPSFTGAER